MQERICFIYLMYRGVKGEEKICRKKFIITIGGGSNVAGETGTKGGCRCICEIS